MASYPSRWSLFASNESGATALEYALITGMFTVAIIASLMAIRDSVSVSLGDVGDAISTAAAAN